MQTGTKIVAINNDDDDSSLIPLLLGDFFLLKMMLAGFLFGLAFSSLEWKTMEDFSHKSWRLAAQFYISILTFN
jgi:hypothetical protein